VGRAALDAAMAWAQRRIQERGRRAKLDPRGLFSASRNPVARALRGSSCARRGDGLGAAVNPGTRASGSARPTGSRNAGVGQCPTHGGCFHRRGIQWRGPFVGRASLDAAMAWAQRRIQERRRRAVPDPRGLFSASRNPVARSLRRSSYARRGDGVGTTLNPQALVSCDSHPPMLANGALGSGGVAIASWLDVVQQRLRGTTAERGCHAALNRA